jgi:hypothetical protein
MPRVMSISLTTFQLDTIFTVCFLFLYTVIYENLNEIKRGFIIRPLHYSTSNTLYLDPGLKYDFLQNILLIHDLKRSCFHGR